jgi:Pyridoxamine 5'-phosphate oxidase
LNYLRTERLLGRLATVGPDGMPHIAPVGWRLDTDGTTIVITVSTAVAQHAPFELHRIRPALDRIDVSGCIARMTMANQRGA